MRAPPFALTAIGAAALLLIGRSAVAEGLALRLEHGISQSQPSAPRALGAAWRDPPTVILPLMLRPAQRLGGQTEVLLAAAGSRDEDPGEPRPPVPPPTPPPGGPSAARHEETVAGLSGVRWALAPIRWGGSLATDLRMMRADGQPRRFQQSETANFNARSYVYQPWFAQIALGLTGLMSKERGEAASRATSLGGNALLSVFPSSRYPFQASFDRTDSRSTDQFTGQDYLTQRIGVRQAYRNLRGDQNSSASFDRSTLTSSSFGRDTVDVINLTHARVLGPDQSMDASANRVRNARSAGGRSLADRVFARHTYANSDDALWRVETLASYGGTREDFGAGDAALGLRTDTFQLNSFGTWRRSDDDPLQVTGGARYFQTTYGGADASRSGTGYASANYRYSPRLTLNAGGSATQSTGGGSSFSTSQFAGANYTPDARRWGEFLYTSNLGANLTNQTGSQDGARRLVSGTGTHAVQRAFDFGLPKALSVSVSQSLGVSQDSVAGGLRTLGHFGSATMSVARGDSLSGFVSASASDQRTSGYSNSSFQLLNLQLSGQGQMGRYSSLTGNYTIQGARQSSDPFNVSQNGGVTYQHLRAFGVAQLRYFAIYERSDFQLNTRVQGDLDATRELISSSFEQRLEYRIGRVDTRLSLRFADIDGRKNALLFLRIVRQFGD